ncbi:DUF3108 domain-containing protein [Luteimonas terricola]|uniref:DUF3108 domain-containing protein n=1 Tax=Luteimonas terricola TaxID=645597 RepID=A0ABQ2EHH1_9GAMM|nr:DUF3108 domain-containing protein [Luteimonas terricola]GGK11914.1 hypothetical protein GCM10011394_21510 [Luteimonas terricola]
MDTRPHNLLLALAASLATAFTAAPVVAQAAVAGATDVPAAIAADDASVNAAPLDAAAVEEAAALQPFLATYDAWNKGKLAGAASMELVREDGHWRIDLGIVGKRGLARWVRLDIDQGTVFDEVDGAYRPLRQDTQRKALFMGREIEGVYDWDTREARWTGDIKDERQEPVPLQDGDMSGLLINLAIIRDARPGHSLSYRFVDGGRVRQHEYAVAGATEYIEVDGLSYEAMRVSRTNGGNDETIVWVARGVPTPIRILQRENGEDTIDLRLVAYQGAP